MDEEANDFLRLRFKLPFDEHVTYFSGEFSLLTLGIFFVLFFFVACWTYGSCVPSGLFVPCILCGAAYGRFVATLLHK